MKVAVRRRLQFVDLSGGVSWLLVLLLLHPKRLAHLPQWRDKSGLHSVNEQAPPHAKCKQSPDSAPAGACVGLFTYPVLQAADILLYGADVVPVGADQTAHIELARELVRSATTRWPALASILRIPTGLVLGAPKINSLRNPTKKMSKSDPSEGGCIYLTDSPDQIRLKVRRAQTDSQFGVSYNAEDRPGIANLLRILSALEVRFVGLELTVPVSNQVAEILYNG
ncbi:tRNA ligase class I [Opisthorchis viverrini]|uniref:tryptophan--tRNA ligase n=1 Tax=Opisthorchis viverrini TaxID=6198 RepID=A0A1S8WUS3_OPIVI|nr:tRNA ligase class I [Opisthorchis viverrini]